MSVTIRDVARAAGMSVATVSRVLNGSGPASPEARRRIEAAALALRYVPNSAARSLSTRTTRTIGVLLPDLYGEFFSEVIRGLDQAARANDYHCLISSSHADRTEVESALRAMQGRVDGLIAMSPDVDARGLAANLPGAIPVVLLNARANGSDRVRPVERISVDNYGGAYAMVRHLASLGHERIAIVTGSGRNHDARERRRGYRAALRDAGLAADPAWELPGDFGDESGVRAAARLLALQPRPTAVFASNDVMAVGLLSALRDAGVRVPDDMAVTGFDDIPLARHLSPALTTVHVDNAELGARAVARLVAALARGRATSSRTGSEILPATLIVRASCGARLRAPPLAMPPPRARTRARPRIAAARALPR